MGYRISNFEFYGLKSLLKSSLGWGLGNRRPLLTPPPLWLDPNPSNQSNPSSVAYSFFFSFFDNKQCQAYHAFPVTPTFYHGRTILFGSISMAELRHRNSKLRWKNRWRRHYRKPQRLYGLSKLSEKNLSCKPDNLL